MVALKANAAIFDDRPLNGTPLCARSGGSRDRAGELYRKAAAMAGGVAADTLRIGIGDLALRLRSAADRRAPPGRLSAVAEAWARRRMVEVSDDVRRAVIANLALTLSPRNLPVEIAVLYPAAHDRLARSLAARAPYEVPRFEQDLAFACGAFLPIGCLWLSTPSSRSLTFSLTCAKQNLGLAARSGRIPTAVGGGWAELHVDPRYLREFDAAGFARGYHRIAALLELRPDLVGVRGVSWLYDPQLMTISPSLSFTRDPVGAGAEIFRLKTDPMQTEYALARSAVRRQLWREGLYRPQCYGLYWRREALIAWSRSHDREGAPIR